MATLNPFRDDDSGDPAQFLAAAQKFVAPPVNGKKGAPQATPASNGILAELPSKPLPPKQAAGRIGWIKLFQSVSFNSCKNFVRGTNQLMLLDVKAEKLYSEDGRSTASWGNMGKGDYEMVSDTRIVVRHKDLV